jgi:hypothetical protein
MGGPFVVWGVERREDHVELDAVDDTRFRVSYGRVWTDAPAVDDGALVASEKLVGLLKALYVPHVEYRPAHIDGGEVVAPYYLVAPLGVVADLADVPADRQIFRLAAAPRPIFFRRSLADLIDQVGIVGPAWREP